MNGGVTLEEMERRKRKALACDAAVEWLLGRLDNNEDLRAVYRILTTGRDAVPRDPRFIESGRLGLSAI